MILVKNILPILHILKQNIHKYLTNIVKNTNKNAKFARYFPPSGSKKSTPAHLSKKPDEINHMLYQGIGW